MKVLKQWNIDELLVESRAIQNRLPPTKSNTSSKSLARAFAKLMFAGKVKATLDLLSKNSKRGVLHLDDRSDPNDPQSPSIREVLKSKHPKAQKATPEAVLPSAIAADAHQVIFDAIDARAISSAFLNVIGSAGPSDINAHEWKRLCCSFGVASNNLCSSLAMTTRRICRSYVDPNLLSLLLASRLIALDKCPGVHTIGIRDTTGCIITKAVLFTIYHT